ncbi:MAG: aminotransferase, partial [Anaerolineales bacterium]|nr:aminotransferase [Anaerolineales bacterium]
MTYNFDFQKNRRDSDSVKWTLFDKDVLPLWVADTDFLVPPKVIESLQERVAHGIFGYAISQESTKQAVKSWLLSRHE